MRKAEDKEKTSAVEADKVEEESLVVAGGRCWKMVLMKALKKTGELNTCFSWKIKFPSCVFFRNLVPAQSPA